MVFVIELEKLFIYSGTQTLSDIGIAYIFPFCGLLFHFHGNALECAKVLNVD